MAKKRSGISIALIFLPVLALLVVFSYVPFWYRASDIAQDKLIGYLEEYQEKGYKIEYSEMKVEGFPLTVLLELKDLTVTSPKQEDSDIEPWQWITPELDVVLLPLKPSELSIQFNKENAIIPNSKGWPDKINITFDIARVNLNKDQKDRLLDLIIDFKKLSISGFDNGAVTIEDLTSHICKTKNVVLTQKDPSYSVSANLLNLDLAAVLTPEKLNKKIDSISIESLILGKAMVQKIKKKSLDEEADKEKEKKEKAKETEEEDSSSSEELTEEERKRRLRKKHRKNKIPFIKKMASWQKNDGSISITELSMVWGDLQARLKGNLDLDEQLQPQAKFEGKTMGLFKVLDSYVQAGLVRSRDATMTKLILGRIVRKPEGYDEYIVKTPFYIKDQIAYIGPLRLFQVPYIYWLGGNRKYYSGLTTGMEIDEEGNVVMQAPTLEKLIDDAKNREKENRKKGKKK